MSLVRYAGGIIECTKQELTELHRRTRKVLTMNGAGLHPRDCVARLYVPRKHDGRGLILTSRGNFFSLKVKSVYVNFTRKTDVGFSSKS